MGLGAVGRGRLECVGQLQGAGIWAGIREWDVGDAFDSR